LPSAAECARAEVEPFLRMTVAERLAILEELQRAADVLLAGRMPTPDPSDADFPLRWSDPSIGCPR
jgi:hypothetical protein